MGMAPLGPTLLDEASLLPCLLLSELDVLEQSVQVHSWLLLRLCGLCGLSSCEGSPRVPALPSGPGLGLLRLGTELWGHA